MRIIASVQVRMGSSRLPGKTMLEIAGKPLLGHLLDRLSHSKQLDGVVVATAEGSENDIIDAYCRSRRIHCYRGSENDVLERMLRALRSVNATVGVEVFGDCPLIDPGIVDGMIDNFVSAKGALDFISNDLKTTYPPGMEVEVFKVSALADSAARTSDSDMREHGTLFIRQHPELYRLRSVEAPPHHQYPELELEVDSAEDVPVITAILEHFHGRPTFSLDDIITFMEEHSDLAALNSNVPRRWKSHRDDDG